MIDILQIFGFATLVRTVQVSSSISKMKKIRFISWDQKDNDHNKIDVYVITSVASVDKIVIKETSLDYAQIVYVWQLAS